MKKKTTSKIIKVAEEIKEGKHSIGYVSSDFRSRFYEKDLTRVVVAPRAIVLPRTMNDKAIESELKPGLCTIGDVLAIIMSKQKEYKDGNWNLFYFEECVVNVNWNADAGEWYVYTWDRDDDGWDAGHRVFSAASDQKHSVTRASDSDTLTLETLNARLKKLEALINPELLK